jgi:L-cysteine desulfidase
MNLLDEILKNEVYPALGCTEPISVAYACAEASRIIKKIDFKTLKVVVNMDPGTYKNGYGVNLPNLNGEKGNMIAAALGVVIKKPELKYKIFSEADKESLKLAKRLLTEKRILLNVDYTKKEIYVEAIISDKNNTASCILNRAHFDVSFMSLNGKIIKSKNVIKEKQSDYKEIIKNLSLKELVSLANSANRRQLGYIETGIEMNLKASDEGLKLKKIGYNLKNMIARGLCNDINNEAKYITSAATDARMGGIACPIMSSGQSGNQGVVAILVPYIYGKRNRIDDTRVLKSIALAHIINSYIKSYTGELAPVCGCAISSGAGASAAVVYQTYPDDIEKIGGAVNNVLADIGGMICDGAKESCSLKVISSVDCALRSAFLSINGLRVESSNGFIGKTAEETIKNVARLSIIGMSSVDSIIIETMKNKDIYF